MGRAFHLQPGEEPFPGFTLHLPLGRGGSGEVWEALGPDGTPVALKFIKCKNSALATKEVRSFQALSQLYHPNLLRVFEVFLQSDYLVIAMELAEGSLTDLLDAFANDCGTAVQPELACEYLSQAATALDFLNSYRHEHEGRRVAFQHCDIKPSNLLLFRDRVKLADFGLSRPMMATQESNDRAGTLDFAAPEVYRGRLTDRTDQYALAVSYCLLRGGRLPFHNTVGRFTPSYARPTRSQHALAARTAHRCPGAGRFIDKSFVQLRRSSWRDFRNCSPPRRKRRPWLPFPIVDALLPKSSFHDCTVFRPGNDRAEPAAIVSHCGRHARRFDGRFGFIAASVPDRFANRGATAAHHRHRRRRHPDRLALDAAAEKSGRWNSCSSARCNRRKCSAVKRPSAWRGWP